MKESGSDNQAGLFVLPERAAAASEAEEPEKDQVGHRVQSDARSEGQYINPQNRNEWTEEQDRRADT